MDIEGRRIWQQAAGDKDRDYVELCLKWDVIVNGPGNRGVWPECKSELQADGRSEKKITDLWRFCEEITDGDLVVLRLGTDVVSAVGEIVGDYEFCEEFNDIDGWEIAHVRRVRWLWKKRKKFEVYTLKQGDTTQLLDLDTRGKKGEKIKTWLESLDVPDIAYDHTPVDLPCNGDADVSVDDISGYLFGKGVASASISNLLDEIGEFIRIANWYQREQRPSEHETVAYLVVPLLRALGWTPQRMAIEWKKIDVALFSSLPRKEDLLSVVVEAKKMDNSCLSAVSQAKGYALVAKHCRRVIVTDGLRYGVFTREKDATCQEKNFSLHSYINLRRLRRGYPLYECSGAQDALLAMAPEWQ